ncbi:MAG: IclR family transcriptional regulator [Nocardioidaceae bacterium]
MTLWSTFRSEGSPLDKSAVTRRETGPRAAVPTNGTQAIDRAAELLSLVVLADEPQGHADLVARTGLAKSTASRLLQALERHRLLFRDDAGTYQAGPLFALYATRHEPVDELTRIAQPTLDRLSAATGETVNLAVVRGNAVVQVAQVDSTFMLGTTNWVGVDVPAHCSALGKVLYAWGGLDLPTEPLKRLTHNTITRPAELGRQLAQIRKQGYAVVRGELEIGLDAVAAPVYNLSGELTAAIGVSGPADRISSELPVLAELIKGQARALSALLGHQPRKEGAA